MDTEHSLTPGEKRRLEAWTAFEESVLKAHTEGRREFTLTFDTNRALLLVDEVLDRQPRNMSRLLADHSVSEMRATMAAAEAMMERESMRFASIVCDLELLLVDFLGLPEETAEDLEAMVAEKQQAVTAARAHRKRPRPMKVSSELFRAMQAKRAESENPPDTNA